jgi:hypothetical protein
MCVKETTEFDDAEDQHKKEQGYDRKFSQRLA